MVVSRVAAEAAEALLAYGMAPDVASRVRLAMERTLHMVHDPIAVASAVEW